VADVACPRLLSARWPHLLFHSRKCAYQRAPAVPLLTHFSVRPVRTSFQEVAWHRALADELVPKELRHIHDDLILHRDKIFAHTDVNGKWEEENLNLNQVEFTVRDGFCSWLIRTIQPMPERVAEFQSLGAALVSKVEYHINKINRKVEKYVPHTNGIYRLILDPKATSAFQSEQGYSDGDPSFKSFPLGN
jgi:hypothetical protein